MLDYERFVAGVNACRESGTLSHMPFIVSDELALLTLRDASGVWKTHSWDGEFSRVPTGLPDFAVECCPQATVTEDGFSFSVVSDHPYSYAIHGLNGHSIDAMSAASVTQTAHAGFSHGAGTVATTKISTLSRTGPTVETTLHITACRKHLALRVLGNKHVMHVAPIGDCKFLATLYSKAAGEEAIVVDVRETAALVSLVAVHCGDRAYKAHIHDGVLYYACASGAGFEDRVVRATMAFDVVPQQADLWLEQIG